MIQSISLHIYDYVTKRLPYNEEHFFVSLDQIVICYSTVYKKIIDKVNTQLTYLVVLSMHAWFITNWLCNELEYDIDRIFINTCTHPVWPWHRQSVLMQPSCKHTESNK